MQEQLNKINRALSTMDLGKEVLLEVVKELLHENDQLRLKLKEKEKTND